jgi:hypothetical protein
MPYFFEPGTYVFRGSYFEQGSVIPLPIEGMFTVTGSAEHLRGEGTWQQHSGRPKSPFTIELDSKDLDGFLGRLVATLSTVNLEGWVATIPEGICAVARDDNRNCVSIQTQRTKPNVYTAQGMILLSGRDPASFTLMVGPFDPEMALENVVALRSGRRA